MNALRTTFARSSIRATHRVQKRQMASAAPEWTGIDKVIRDRFPEDWQGEHNTLEFIYVGRVRAIQCIHSRIVHCEMESI